MTNVLRMVIVVAFAGTLGSCADYRFGGTSSCAPDGSVVWLEKPNSDGSFEGLKNSPENC